MSDVAAQLETAEKTIKRNRPIEICLEEWNGRHYKRDISSGEEVLLRESPRNIGDALFVAGVFNACQRLSYRVTMTNYIFILNAHGPLMVYDGGVLKTALYDVFRNYAELCGPIAIATEIRSENFTTAVHQAGPDVSVICTRIDASATKSQDSRHVTLSLINRYRDRSCRVKLDFKNRRLQGKGVWHLLQADNLLEANTRDHPDRIQSHSHEISLAGQTLDLPAVSVSHLQVELT